MMNPFLLFAVIGVGFTLSGAAAAPQPLMTRPGTLLFSDDFAGPALNEKWQAGGRPKSLTVVDGALRGVCSPEDGHGPSLGVPLDGRDLTVAFSMKYERPGGFLFLVDGESQFGGAAHLLRVGLATNLIAVQQDRGAPASKLAQKKEKDAAAKAGRKAPVPTKEQLADRSFYRTERLGAQRREIADGRWHDVLVEISGNEVLVQVDNGTPITATATVLDTKKSRIVFLVGQAGTALIDNVKVWENSPSPGWPAMKAKLAPPAR